MKTSKRNNILLVHGIFLLLVTAGNTISSIIGLNTGSGTFGFLKAMPLAEVGLFQAYLLMMLIGIILLMNIKNKDSWKYDLIGALAHLIPISALLLFNNTVKETMGVKVVIASSIIHIPWILIEFVTAYRQFKKNNE